MCGVPVHAAEAYLARLIKGGHRVAIAEQIESPAEARKARGSKALVDRAIVRVVTAGTLTEEALLESACRQLACRGRRAPATTGRSPLPTSRPGGSSWWLAASASLPLRSRGLSPAELIAADPVPGVGDDRRQRRVRKRCRRASAQKPCSGWRPSTGSARPRAPSLPRRAACSLTSTPRRKAAAPCSMRHAGSRGPAIWRSTPRPATASNCAGPPVVGKRQPARRDRPLSERRRAPAAWGRHQRAIDRPGGDRGAAGIGRLALWRRDPPRARARRAQVHARHRAGRWPGSPPGAAARATSASCATGLPRRRR